MDEPILSLFLSFTSPLCFVRRPTLARANNESIISLVLNSPSALYSTMQCDPWPALWSLLSNTSARLCYRPNLNHAASLLVGLIIFLFPPFSPPFSDFQTHRSTWALWCCGREWVPRCRQHGWSPGSSGCRADGRPYQSFGRECWRHRSGACPWPVAATPTPGIYSRTEAGCHETTGDLCNQTSPLELGIDMNGCVWKHSKKRIFLQQWINFV